MPKLIFEYLAGPKCNNLLSKLCYDHVLMGVIGTSNIFVKV